MTDRGGKRDAHSLVSLLLGKPAASAPVLPDEGPAPGGADAVKLEQLTRGMLAASEAVKAGSGAGAGAETRAGTNTDPEAKASATQGDIDREASELVDVYFTLEEPAERDALFDRLIALSSPIVTEFLRAMMEEDEDEHLRAAATGELARRGVPEAEAALEARLIEAEDAYFFAHALSVLAELRGPRFYDRVLTLWQEPERDADERREAMLTMETLDPARAMADFARFIDAQTDMRALADDQIEVAMLAFVRQGYRAGMPVLEALHARIGKAQLDPEERQELLEFVQEGMDLLALPDDGT